MERVLGHVVALLLLRRELLCLLESSCTFVGSSYERRQPLWPSVLKEFKRILSLLPVVVADTTLPWHATVTAVDASPSGFGAVETEWLPEEVRSVGALRERARFRGPLASTSRPTSVHEQIAFSN